MGSGRPFQELHVEANLAERLDFMRDLGLHDAVAFGDRTSSSVLGSRMRKRSEPARTWMRPQTPDLVVWCRRRAAGTVDSENS
jgi:hypothetical protein